MITTATGLVRQALALNRAGVEVRYGLRCAIGVAVPLVIAYAVHLPLDGVSAAIGAMAAGFASRQGVYRTRAAAMLLTSAAMAFSCYVGSVTGPYPVPNIILFAVWGFSLGLLGSLGASATTVGMNSVIALLICGHAPYVPSDALPQAAFVLLGGALQTLLLVSIWPLQRFTAERRVLAAAYRALSEYAADLPATRAGSPPSGSLETVGATLADPQPFARRSELIAFESLLDEAERIRGRLAALATDRDLLDDTGADEAGTTIHRMTADASPILSEIAAAVDDGRAPAELEGVWHVTDLDADALEEQVVHVPFGATVVDDARALLAAMRTAWRAAGVPAGGAPSASPARPHAPEPFALSALGDAIETLRANLSPRSVFAQHALRLAMMLVVAGVLERWLPLQRAYWIPLTAVIVLRPDFTGTFTRGIARVGGTVVGAVIASLITALVHPAGEVYLFLAIAFATAGYVLFNVNYAVFSVSITCYVVFLLAFAGAPEHTSAVDRVGATLLGGVLALLSYVVWPTWSHEHVPDDIADLVDAQRRQTAIVLGGYLEPSTYDPRSAHDAQLASWRARSTAEAAIDQMVAEPVQPRGLRASAALALLAAGRRYGIAVLTLYSRLPAQHPVAHTQLALLADELDGALHAISAALRDRSSEIVGMPRLRATQVELKRALDAAPDPDLAAIVSETDLLVESVQAMLDALRRDAAEESSTVAS
ncbi:MAG TPA: FUSC family protein [Candidatus Elarobacter sp.]|nr:FUSC family protein [Candidatus Elarobacter sp.]